MRLSEFCGGDRKESMCAQVVLRKVVNDPTRPFMAVGCSSDEAAIAPNFFLHPNWVKYFPLITRIPGAKLGHRSQARHRAWHGCSRGGLPISYQKQPPGTATVAEGSCPHYLSRQQEHFPQPNLVRRGSRFLGVIGMQPGQMAIDSRHASYGVGGCLIVWRSTTISLPSWWRRTV